MKKTEYRVIGENEGVIFYRGYWKDKLSARAEAVEKNLWIQFDVDYFAGQEPGECSICGRELESGWLCMDGGEEVCHDHVEYKEERK